MLRTWRPSTLMGLAYLGFIGLGVRSGLLGVAWPFVRADFDLSLDALGALLAPGSIGYLVGSFVSGRALARWPLGVLLAGAFAGVSVYLIGTGAAPVWWLLLAVGVPGGLGAGLVDAGLNTYVTNRQGPRQMNWLHASWGVGATVSPFIMTAAISSGIGWRWTYVVAGVIMLALSAGYLVTRHAWPTRAELVHPDSDGNPSDAKRRGTAIWHTLRLPITWVSMLLFIAYTGVELGMGQWAFPLLVSSRGIGTVQAGAAVSVYWAGLTAGRFLFGGIVAAIGVQRLLEMCLVGSLLLLGLLWAPVPAPVAFATLGLLGIVLAPVFPALVSLTPDRFGSAHTANAVGFQVAASVVGGAGLPALMGVLAQGFGLETVVPTLLAAAVLELACFVVWLRYRAHLFSPASE
jgi:fucose permease